MKVQKSLPILLFLTTQLSLQKKTLHLIAHSHMDAGWGRFAIEYYNGVVAGVFTSVTDYLWSNPDKRFTQAEIWFFQKWWYEQSPETQSRVK
jgi:alpha-mannosidase